MSRPPRSSPVETEHHEVYPAIDPSGELRGAATGLKIAITGASRGCGRATAVAFATAGAAKLFLLGRDTSALQETVQAVEAAGKDCKTYTYQLDLKGSDYGQVTDTILKDAEGVLDVLVNNAGVLEEWLPINESDTEVWWNTWELNLRSLYLMTKAVLPAMLQRGAGTIINTTSAGGLRTAPGASAYQGSKTAVIRFTDFLDTDHGKHGIRTFAMHPGGVSTDLAVGMPKYMHAILTDPPELSGALCVYLCTPKADFLRGRYVGVHWDVTELEQRKDEIVDKNLLKLQLTM